MAELVVVALLCLASTWFIPAAPSAVPGLPIDRNLLGSTFSLIGDLRRDPRMWVGALGSSWFWLSGSVALVLVPVIVKQRIGAGVEVETAISLFFAVGVGVGLAAGGLARARPHRAEARALGGRRHGAVPARRRGGPPPGPRRRHRGSLALGLPARRHGAAARDRPHGPRLRGRPLLRAGLLGRAVLGGAKERRARVVAGVGVLNALFMVVGAGLTALLQTPWVAVPNPASCSSRWGS